MTCSLIIITMTYRTDVLDRLLLECCPTITKIWDLSSTYLKGAEKLLLTPAFFMDQILVYLLKTEIHRFHGTFLPASQNWQHVVYKVFVKRICMTHNGLKRSIRPHKSIFLTVSEDLISDPRFLNIELENLHKFKSKYKRQPELKLWAYRKMCNKLQQKYSKNTETGQSL